MTETHTASSALNRPGFSARFWSVGGLTLLSAVLLNSLITLAAHALFPVAPTFAPLQLANVIPATLVATIGALGVFALISRRSNHPALLFRRIGLGVLLISIIPGLLLPVIKIFPGTTLLEVGALLLLHVACALLCIYLAPLTIDTRS